jgi:hypothetical protein
VSTELAVFVFSLSGFVGIPGISSIADTTPGVIPAIIKIINAVYIKELKKPAFIFSASSSLFFK